MNDFLTRGIFAVISCDSITRTYKSLGVTVSHVTGTVSRIPIAMFNDDFETFALVTSILLSFGFGCFLSGFIVGDSKFKLGSPYGICLSIEAGALFLSFLFLRRFVSFISPMTDCTI